MSAEHKIEDFVLSSAEEIIAAARDGQMFILADDEGRENEGDIIIPAQMATPAAINFMATHGRGLVCLAMEKAMIDQLGLAPMVQKNTEAFGTAFTVSIEAKEGVTTGISAPDRAHTVQVAINPGAGPDDVVSPGHVFPLMAQDGGVLVRAGHTEAAVDVARLAGLLPAAVICEVMKDDGTMARLPDLMAFAKVHGIKVGTIADLIVYRLQHEKLVERVSEQAFSCVYGGDFKLITYRNRLGDEQIYALQCGDIGGDAPLSVRVHRLDMMGDVLGASDSVLQKAMKDIAKQGRGVVVLLPPQNERRDPKQMTATPVGQRLRAHGIGAQILRDIGVKDMVLLTREPKQVSALTGFGLNIVEQRSL